MPKKRACSKTCFRDIPGGISKIFVLKKSNKGSKNLPFLSIKYLPSGSLVVGICPLLFFFFGGGGRREREKGEGRREKGGERRDGIGGEGREREN